MQQPADQPEPKRVLLDVDRCIECRSCSAACYYSHAQQPVVQFARSGPALLPVVCRQCKAAPCVDACPNEAMSRDEAGVVKRALFRCIGCGCCALACPFGVIPEGVWPTGRVASSNGRVAAKCDLCVDRLAGDPQAVPRCVAACPARALVFAYEAEAEASGLTVIGGRSAGEHPLKRR